MDIAQAADRRTGEYLTHDPENRFVAIAPHGGKVERHTETQAFRLAALLEDCSAWAFTGYVDGGDTRDAFHTTSVAISPDDYRLLEEVLAAEFSHAVAFHGYRELDHRPDIYVGGRCDEEDRRVLASRIAEKTGREVACATADDDLDVKGFDPHNIVNRVAGGAGLQIEQTFDVRANQSRAVCEAVAEVLPRIAGE